MAGYHKREIKRGAFGEISKIREELDELEDALEQDVRIMVGVELSDLYGALQEFADRQGYQMEDLRKMSRVTNRAFALGYRKPR